MALFLSSKAFATNIAPTPFPVFLKVGFSSVLEFEDTPTRVVLGDAQSFQIERLERSIVVKTLASYAASNLFVYFAKEEPRLFVLTASEDAEPTYYRRFEAPIIQRTPLVNARPGVGARMGVRPVSAKFDATKDYLTVEIEVAAGSDAPVKPIWDNIRIRYGSSTLAPHKLWAERKEAQKDSRIRSRLIFAKPNIPRDLKGVFLVVPIYGNPNAASIALAGNAR